MEYTTLPAADAQREMVDVFRGYNRNYRIGDGEFFNMENLTGDHYPVLSPREKRGTYAVPTAAAGLIDKDALCYIDGTDFVMNEYRVDLGLSEGMKQLVSMGAYVVIFPDKKWINTLDLTQHGSLEASFSTVADVTFELCTLTGDVYAGATVSPTEPTSPENGALWIDTSATPHALKQYSASGAVWVSIASTYVKIHSVGLGAAFGQYDGVTVSGVTGEALQDLNGSHVVWAKGEDFIVISGMLDSTATQTAAQGAVQVRRTVPEMDFVVEAENRLWGCRYGVNAAGQVVNELYASKLGDFKNWNCFMGIATDSWAASVGTDGPFTGAVTHLGYPTFWKENCLHKVYISAQGAHQVQDTACRGVQKGSGRSLAIVGSTLYYKSGHGVCAYDGSLPVEISTALGEEDYSLAVSGSYDSKYYISMKDGAEAWHLFVYDTKKQLWHRHDNLHALDWCACDGALYCLEAGGNILAVAGGAEADEGEIRWMAETGELGLQSPDAKYLARLTLRLSLVPGGTVDIYAQYDLSAEWTHLCTVQGSSLRSFSVPVRPRRCDHLRLRLVGRGEAKVYSITKTIQRGSELT